eukprot:scaffold25411_cov152-Cylindrotheca_fusiformis.AAC.5
MADVLSMSAGSCIGRLGSDVIYDISIKPKREVTNRSEDEETMSTEVIPLKKRTVESATEETGAQSSSNDPSSAGSKKRTPEQSRALRLAQNRKAARESRRRKKALVEDLQRSLVFFSRTNANLKQQNDDLTRRLLESHTILAKMGERVPPFTPGKTDVSSTPTPAPEAKKEEAVAATGATPIKPRPATLPLPVMQPGATMQAMADFQQAAAVAMAAEQGIGSSSETGSSGSFERKHAVAMV